MIIEQEFQADIEFVCIEKNFICITQDDVSVCIESTHKLKQLIKVLQEFVDEQQ